MHWLEEASASTVLPAPPPRRRGRELDNEGIIPVLARAVREVEAAAQRGRSSRRAAPSSRSSRCWRARSAPGSRPTRPSPRPSAPSSSSASTASARSSPRPRPATPPCSPCSPRTPSSPTPPATLKRDMLGAAGVEAAPEELAPPEPTTSPFDTERRVVPQSVISRQLANPFLAPDFSGAQPRAAAPARLATWELIGPLLGSFERASGGASSCMDLPEDSVAQGAAGPRADAAPGPGRRGRRGRPPHLPARRRARPRQDRPGAARGPGRQRLPAARRRPERRQDQLGARGRPLDAATARPP